MDLSKLTSKELKELLMQKKEEERQQALQRRDAYEGIRADLLFRMEQKVRQTVAEVQGLHTFCADELDAFYRAAATGCHIESNSRLASDTVATIYAAYVSAARHGEEVKVENL